jgi:rhamnose utilization protein RhaD (predicted bifunctional aldolase and dehydrogenase)
MRSFVFSWRFSGGGGGNLISGRKDYQDAMQLLETLTRISHEFGTPLYVKAGGGNTSAKDPDTLWIKPSGIALSNVAPDSFVAIDRAKLTEVFSVSPPRDTVARETMVKDLMMAAVRPESKGRPSVESPLHGTFESTFVVHTHPEPVNGMLCAMQGAEVCRRLFPDALWIDYTDPGYTLSMHTRRRILEYVAAKGREPSMVFMQNHGLFVAGDTHDDVRETHDTIMGLLDAEYGKAGVATRLAVGPMPSSSKTETIRRLLQEARTDGATMHVAASGPFKAPGGPMTPDHVVYMKAHVLFGDATAQNVEVFRARYGYFPQVLCNADGVFGVGTTEKNAQRALDLALDGALIEQLAEAFGGIRYMSAAAADFIDNWEVEAYRRVAAS